MHPRSSLSQSQREELVDLFEGAQSYRSAASSMGVAVYPVKRLYQRWRLHGRSVLVSRQSKQQHSFEIKLEVVQRYERQEATLTDLAQEYGLSSVALIRRWVRIYRIEGKGGLRPKRKGRPPGTPSPPLSEVEKLQRENERLRAEVAYLKKARALRGQGLR